MAVLSAVSNNTVSTEEQKKIAFDVFNTHYSGPVKLNLSFDAADGRVSMNANGVKEASIAAAAGIKGIKINATSTAVMNRQNTICVLALANEGEAKLRFLYDTTFNSPTCSVQSNSSHPLGILSKSSNTPVAKFFCSAGGADGEFTPAIRGECGSIDDPYTHLAVPESGVCMPPSTFATNSDELGGIEKDISYFLSFLPVDNNFQTGNPMIDRHLAGHEPWVDIRWQGLQHQHYHCDAANPNKCNNGMHDIDELHAPSERETRVEGLGLSRAEIARLSEDYGLENVNTVESINYTKTDDVFYPGTYCGGLTVNGQNVTFMPGVYIIKDGPLTFKNEATAFAEDVSFVLKGLETTVTVETGSYVYLKAPSKGPMAGMALYQDRDGDTQGSKPPRFSTSMMMNSFVGNDVNDNEPDSGGDKYPTAVNILSSGGELNVTGTIYLPTQALDVLGDGVLGAQAPATSFIAHQVTFAGKTNASVAVDVVKGKIRPMLPLSDDGARLIE